MTGAESQPRQRLRQVLRHLSAPSCCQASLFAAAAAVGPQLRADAAHAPVDRELLAHHLRQLERDGVTVLDEVYTREQVAQWQAALDAAWVPLKAELPSLDWRTYRFKQHYLDADSFCTGKVLYEGKRVARRDDGTGVIDMGRGRFDVYGTALETNAALSVIVDEPPPMLAAIAKSLLHEGYSPDDAGALPTLLPSEEDKGGTWHRDAYSLFENETLDLALPWFYLTAILPLSDLGPGEGATEFCLGSHKANLGALGITTREGVEAWAEGQPKLEATMRAGSICLFHGFTLHRGGPITARQSSSSSSSSSSSDGSVAATGGGGGRRSRDVLYYGFTKNWYNAEPRVDYDLV